MSSEPGGGFRAFNATGRDDVTTEILRPRADSATIIKRVIGIAIAVVLLAIIGITAFKESHIRFDEDSNATKFAQPQSQGD